MATAPKLSEPRKPDTAPLASDVSARSGQKVVVCCKLPMGLVLELDVKRMEMEQTPTGPQKVEIWRKGGKQVRVRGTRTRFGEAPTWEMAGGYALTANVDKDFWDEWLEQNKDQAYVINHVIFALPTIDAAKGRATELKAQLSGFEPLNPARKHIPGTDRTEPVDPRWPTRQRLPGGSISEVGTGERTEA